ncbi:MAG: hypothetical protein DRQ24_11740 [Candidatus Latescibacterota bacterium]|nr:MAG: hypothetical protein DRQ24_11740 [Candidatus Latescibacterota bacterium]
MAKIIYPRQWWDKGRAERLDEMTRLYKAAVKPILKKRYKAWFRKKLLERLAQNPEYRKILLEKKLIQ